MATITFELDTNEHFPHQRVRVTCSDRETMQLLDLALSSYFHAWGSGPTAKGLPGENYCTYAFPTERDIVQARYYYPLPSGLRPMQPLD